MSDVSIEEQCRMFARMLVNVTDRLDRVEARMLGLETAAALRSGTIGAPGGDSDPVIVTEAEGNTTR